MEIVLNERELLAAIAKAQSQYIGRISATDLFDDMLSSLLALTKSEYGFIGEIKYQDDGTPFLKTHALTNIAWNEETRTFYEENAPYGLEFYNLKTLFGHVITSEEVVIANSPKEDKRAGGIPEGHPPLNHFLGVPFHLADKFVGMVGIANRPGGYSSEIVEFLKPFLMTCAQLIEAYRIDRENKQVIDELVKTKDAAEKANQAKSEFLAHINHEIRTPLHGVIGLAELIEEYIDFNYDSDDKLKGFIKQLISSGQHLSDLVSDTLDFAKIEAGEMTLEISAFDINLLIQEVCDLLQTMADDFSNDLNFEVLSGGQTVVADKQKLKQVLLNLVSNAIKYTEKGAITVNVGRTVKANGPHISIQVADTGIGISEDEQAHVFTAFRQVDESITKERQGTGLGLSISKSYVEMMSGELSLISTLGKGSIFTVELPIKG